LGKTGNCQVGVYSILSRGEHAVPIGFRLILPQCWIDDPQRCKRADVPDEFIEFQSKPDLAAQLVIEVRGYGAAFEWVSTDALYGNNPAFKRRMDRIRETFMVDVSKS
jgi:SRSO17 transposase